MRIIEEGDRVWHMEFLCANCGTMLEADEKDLEFDHFKAKGTYWYDGSAGTGVPKFFVRCPACRKLIFPDPTRIPTLVKNEAEARSK